MRASRFSRVAVRAAVPLSPRDWMTIQPMAMVGTSSITTAITRSPVRSSSTATPEKSRTSSAKSGFRSRQPPIGSRRAGAGWVSLGLK